MKRQVKFVLIGLIVSVLISGSVNFSLAQQKKPIKFVTLGDLTGPVHTLIAPMVWGAEDYFSYLNQQGGIDGHSVPVEVIDTKYQLPLIRTAYSRIKEMKQTAISFDALSGGIEALRSQFAADKVPVLMVTGHGPALYPPSWVFSVLPPYDDTLCAMAEWIISNWKEKRKPRLALFLGDYASGRSPEVAKWYVEKKGIDIVAVEYCPLQPTDTSDLLIRIRDAKPDFIFDTLTTDQVKVALKDRLKLGIRIPQVNFVSNSLIIMKTVSPEAYADYMNFQTFGNFWEKHIPGVQLAYKLYSKRGDIPPDPYILTVGAMMVWAEAVKNALKKVGYEALDGPAIYEGYMQIRNFTAMGIFKEITYTKDDLRGCKWLKVCKFNKDGTMSNVTDYIAAPHNLRLKAETESKK